MNPNVAYLKSSEAAQLLGIDPQTLRMWERQFGLPASTGPTAWNRRFAFREVIALRHAMLTENSVSAAVSRVRARLYGITDEPANPDTLPNASWSPLRKAS